MDPERLRREFPDLTAQDLEAYAEVTGRILDAPPAARPRVTRDALEGGRRARDKAGRGEPLEPAESLLARYLNAVAKMQGKGPGGGR